MASKKSLSIQLELLWWVLSLIVVIAILYPIWKEVESYPFYLSNIIFILTFITITRYIFLLKHTFLATKQVLKVAIMLLLIPFIFYLVSKVNFFQTFLDEEGATAILGDLSYQRIGKLINYVKAEMMFFGVGAVIACVIFFGRLMMSVWLYRNRGRV